MTWECEECSFPHDTATDNCVVCAAPRPRPKPADPHPEPADPHPEPGDPHPEPGDPHPEPDDAAAAAPPSDRPLPAAPEANLDPPSATIEPDLDPVSSSPETPRRTPAPPPSPGVSAAPVVLIGAVVLLLLAGGGWLLNRDDTVDQTGAATPVASDPAYPQPELPSPADGAPPAEQPTWEPTSEPLPPTPSPVQTMPSQVGLVSVAVTGYDPRVLDVARMFDGHFGQINSGDYPAAAAYFDPSGVVNPDDPVQVAAFAESMNTTRDSDLVLHFVTDGPYAGPVLARLTFRSEQAAGKGPAERPDETCTRWDITYQLSSPSPTEYRIVRPDSATSEPCST